jgi:hydroxyacylglutathione hydrolase
LKPINYYSLMVQIQVFVFNPFQVNTYILYDETGQAVIIDPACNGKKEEKELGDFISFKTLTPFLSMNTHAHLDHIIGNNFIYREYGLKTMIHKAGIGFVEHAPYYGSIYGLKMNDIIIHDRFLQDNEIFSFGNSSLKILYTPGHADGHVCMLSQEQGFALVGDVIFFESIGRCDLPTGNHTLLVQSIRERIFTLDSKTWLYPGHGHETTVDHEKRYNPFLVNID